MEPTGIENLCACCVRATFSVWQASASAELGNASNAARCAARAASSASLVRADKVSMCMSRAGSAASGSCDGGASSNTVKALVPPRPSEFTAARRGAEPAQSRHSVLTKKGEAAKPIFGFGVEKFRLGGMRRWCSAKAVLIKEATPDACSRWPMFVFTDPTAQKPVRFVPVRKARVSASISSGSPTAVPVPWHSTKPISSGDTPATAIASTIARAWPATLDAV